MKKIFAILSVIVLLTAYPAYAGFTQSTDLEASSEQGWFTNTQITASGGGLSVCSWITLESLPIDGENYRLVRKKDVANTTGNFDVYLGNFSGTYRLVGEVNDSGANVTDSAGTLTMTTLNTWTFVCAIFNGGAASGQRWQFYQDGTTPLSLTSFTSNATTYRDTNVPTYVGIANVSGTYVAEWDGKLSHTSVYNDDLAIATLYANRCEDHSADSTLEAEWKFDGTGNDSSGNGYNLTAVNSAGFVANGPPCAAAGGTFAPWQFQDF